MSNCHKMEKLLKIVLSRFSKSLLETLRTQNRFESFLEKPLQTYRTQNRFETNLDLTLTLLKVDFPLY